MAKRIFFQNARIVDGTGVPALENGVLVTDVPETEGAEGKILFVGTAEQCGLTPTAEDDVVDLKGYSLLPGLFNCHVHLWLNSPKPAFKADHLGVPFRTILYWRMAMEALLTGTTTLRTCGGSDDIDTALRDAINRGIIAGSRIVACGSPIEPNGGHCWVTWGTIECSGADEFVRAARQEMRKGVDQVKLMYSGGAGGGAAEDMYGTHITDEEAAAVCKAAHMRGHKVVAHLSNDMAIRSALRAGVDSYEHCYSMNEETAKLLAEKDVYYVPTMLVTASSDYMPKPKDPLGISRWENLKNAHEKHKLSVQYAVKNGVKICVGTDSPPGMQMGGAFATVFEMLQLAEQGMSPLEVIRAATYNSAELCGLSDKTGSLQAGLYGDLTVYKGAPDQNIQDMKNLDMVVKGGRVVWSNVEGYQKTRGFGLLPQDGQPTDGLGKMYVR